MPILETEFGIKLPDIIIVPSRITVDVLLRVLEFAWSFYVSPTAYLAGKKNIVDNSIGVNVFPFLFTEDTTPNFQQALDIFDWANGGEIQDSQTTLDFFGTQPDPTSEDDIISDNWDGMIYNP